MYVPKRSGADLDKVDSPDVDAKELEDIQREQESATFLRRPSNVDRIHAATREYNFQAMKLLAAENEDLLDRDIIIHNLQVQQKRNYGLLSLPFSLMFFCAFAYSAFQHEDVTNRYVIESGLQNVLGAGAADLSNIKETWQWLNHTLFPKVFKQTDHRGVLLEDKLEWGKVLSYNTLVGPVFIEQARSTQAPCANDASGIAEDMLCYDMTTTDTQPFGKNILGSFTITPPHAGDYNSMNVTMEERATFFDKPFKIPESSGRRLRKMVPTNQDRLSGGAVAAGIGQEGFFRAMFYPNMQYSIIQERLNYMYERQWLDKQTKHITIFANFLNSEMGRPRLQQYQLTLSFARSGDVFRKLRVNTIFLSFWSGLTSMAADAAFAIMLAIVTYLEIRTIYRARKQHELMKHMRTGWFVLQAATIVAGWAILLGYQYSNTLLSTLQKELDAVIEAQKQDLPAEINDLGATFTDSIGDWVWAMGYVALAVAQYHLALMMRFFVAFRAQPRLGVVVNTLEACALDILHFLVILLPSLFSYSISGCFVFGKRLEEFSDIKSAIGYCFKILTETEYDWPALSEEHFWTTGMWVWSFMVFLAMLMLNMVLAIVLDVYSEQRKSAGKSESIVETVVSIYTVLKHRKRWIGTTKAIKTLEAAPRLMSRGEFLKLFPTMTDKQAKLLIVECQNTATSIHAGPEQMKHTMRMAMALKVAMDQVAEAVDEIDSGSYRPDEGVSTALKEGNWIREIQQEMATQNHDMMQLQWNLQQLTWQWSALDSAHGKGTVFNPAPVAALVEEKIL